MELALPYNGAGIFTRNFNWVNDKNSAIPITASRMDADSNDFATAFNNSLTRDGQGVATATLPMGGFRHTGVGNGVALNDYAALGQVQNNGVKFAVAGGTADALTATLAPAPVLVDGFEISLRAANANATTTPTLALNGGTARTITKFGGSALAVGDITGNLTELILRYNLANTRWELVTLPGVTGAALLASANIFTADQTIRSTDAGASAAPNLILDRFSASPAVSDVLAMLQFLGRSSTAASRIYTAIQAAILDPTNTSEDARLDLMTMVAGTLAARLSVGQGLFSPNATGGDKGADTANFSNIYRNGGLIDRRVPAVHATGYTQLATDEFVELVANSGGAVAWTMMSGATFGAGGIQYVSCEVAGTVLTLTRAGSDTFASGSSTTLTTLVLNTGDRGYLVCDGGSPAIWRFHGTRHFDSGVQTITAGGALTLAHGLGVEPTHIEAYLQNVTGEAGYTTGQRIQVGTGINFDTSAAVLTGASSMIDATNITVRYSSKATNSYTWLNATTGAGVNLTNANWKALWRAWVYN